MPAEGISRFSFREEWASKMSRVSFPVVWQVITYLSASFRISNISDVFPSGFTANRSTHRMVLMVFLKASKRNEELPICSVHGRLFCSLCQSTFNMYSVRMVGVSQTEKLMKGDVSIHPFCGSLRVTAAAIVLTLSV